ncbi:MAG: AMP-binding protein [Ilumatobacteraceae bacterium]
MDRERQHGRRRRTGRLVAIDMPGGPQFVETLSRVWDAGDAAFVVDRRNPPARASAVLDVMAPSAVIDEHGDESARTGGRPIEAGDALVVATSGTTGSPKGVVLGHAAVAASAAATSARLGITATDHWLACLPLAHIGGLSVVTRALHLATPLTVLDGFDADAVMRSEATLVSLVPTALARIGADRFRVVVLGGSAPPAVLPSNVVTTYGMTETGSGIVYDGVPLDGVDVRVDEQGAIAVRGPMLLRVYRDGTDPFVDGWFPTSDVGAWDVEGRLVVHGRDADLIISGGENVWPAEVEAALRQHPDVAAVAVAGLPDDEWGAAVGAFVVARSQRPSLHSLRDHVKDRLPAHSAPRRLYVVERLPMTTLGKIDRPGLLALAGQIQPETLESETLSPSRSRRHRR